MSNPIATIATPANVKSSIHRVKFNGSLKQHDCQESLVDVIVKKIYAIPNYAKLSSDVELIKFICNSIENGLKTDVTVDKRAIAIQIMKQVFPDITDKEIEFISNTIDFLCSNGMVTKITDYCGYARTVFNFFLNK